MANVTLLFFALFPVLAAAILATVFMCLWIYHDARERGMDNPALWVLLGILVPNFLGLIIYLVVRSANGKKHPCPQCGIGVTESQGFCPRCGARQPSVSELAPATPVKAKKYLRGFFISLGVMALGFLLFFVPGFTSFLTNRTISGPIHNGYSYSLMEVAPNYSGTNIELTRDQNEIHFTFSTLVGEHPLDSLSLEEESTLSVDLRRESGTLFLEITGPKEILRIDQGQQALTLEPGDYTITAFAVEAQNGEISLHILP